mmetsp:Transcript_24300/g.91749  ORF Transcript_24300/g.91749 Transcript_24300/m.91749 type:complete len:224 (+) Transcript_24300:543-1214(+)
MFYCHERLGLSLVGRRRTVDCCVRAGVVHHDGPACAWPGGEWLPGGSSRTLQFVHWEHLGACLLLKPGTARFRGLRCHLGVLGCLRLTLVLLGLESRRLEALAASNGHVRLPVLRALAEAVRRRVGFLDHLPGSHWGASHVAPVLRLLLCSEPACHHLERLASVQVRHDFARVVILKPRQDAQVLFLDALVEDSRKGGDELVNLVRLQLAATPESARHETDAF